MQVLHPVLTPLSLRALICKHKKLSFSEIAGYFSLPIEVVIPLIRFWKRKGAIGIEREAFPCSGCSKDCLQLKLPFCVWKGTLASRLN